jgi:hypothetical protein
MARTTKTIDSKSVMSKLTKGFETKATMRGGKSGFTLIQRGKRTLAMASVRNDGAIKLEGNRIGKSLRIETAAEIASARKAMEAVAKANAAKAKPKASGKKEPTAADAAAGSDAVTKARVAKAQAATGVKVVAPSDKRARSRSSRGDVIA